MFFSAGIRPSTKETKVQVFAWWSPADLSFQQDAESLYLQGGRSVINPDPKSPRRIVNKRRASLLGSIKYLKVKKIMSVQWQAAVSTTRCQLGFTVKLQRRWNHCFEETKDILFYTQCDDTSSGVV